MRLRLIVSTISMELFGNFASYELSKASPLLRMEPALLLRYAMFVWFVRRAAGPSAGPLGERREEARYIRAALSLGKPGLASQGRMCVLRLPDAETTTSSVGPG